MAKKAAWIIAGVLLLAYCRANYAQQVADTAFAPPIAKPAYARNAGPLVLIDEAHQNFHTVNGRYRPFADLLRRDGYLVKGLALPLSKEALQEAKILVIANALSVQNSGGNWSLPTPSAFSDEEITALAHWVKAGHALFLIADHMPFPGCTEKLAAAFGVRWNNGFVMDEKNQAGAITFKRSTGTLANHPITNGRNKNERVDSVTTFTGSAFESSAALQPLLILGPTYISQMPQIAWQFTAETPRVAVNGWPQSAALTFGKGRVVFCGEAAMFSAQLAGPNRTPVGMNAPMAVQNAQFLLNAMHWLSGLL